MNLYFKKNPILKFLSSVKLAVPLMFVLVVTVAFGTIIESRYNTDMARMLVYQTMWFQLLLGLLFINILFAALSRLPWQKHHTGFLITHLGMLILLIGSMMTNIWGIDGQLRVEEKKQSNEVVLSDLVLELINVQTNHARAYKINRSLNQKSFEDFKGLNEALSGKLSVLKYLPLAKSERAYKKTAAGDGSVALSFRLKSPFFDTTEWLHSETNPEVQMGPAQLKLVVHEGKKPQTAKRNEVVASSKNSLEVYSKKTGKLLKSIPIKNLQEKPVLLGDVTIALIKKYERASVEKNKISEAGQSKNPALELSVMQNSKSYREVLFAQFPSFSMQPNGIFGLSFKYVASDSGITKNMPQDSIHSKLAEAPASDSQIQFHYYKSSPDKVEIKLSKANREIQTHWLRKSEGLQTPWMGIQVFINDLVIGGAEFQDVKPRELELRSDMPPAALLINVSNESFWLMEGDVLDVQIGDEKFQVYFGRETLRLPFKIYLEKFAKLDYPGTQTPMSFESMVRVDDSTQEVKISMNEPMHHLGYTLYQSSYVMGPGMPTSSVFSVNQDPGRAIKYAGSLILVCGILIFTLMRSRMAKQKWGI